MSTITIGTNTPPFIQERLLVTNGRLPQAGLYTRLATHLNQAVAYRRKELFRWAGPFPTLAAGTRNRWRFRCHTGPMVKRLVAMVVSDRVGTSRMSPAATLTITDGGAYNVTKTSHALGYTGVPTNTPDQFGRTYLYFDAPPSDSEVWGTFADVNSRLLAACIWEEALDPDTSNGYLQQNYGVLQPILNTDRAGLMQLADTMWRRGASQLWNWSADQDSAAPVMAATAANVIDGGIFVATSSAGPTLDLRYKNSASATTVPCILAVYASATVSGTATLKNAAGTIVATTPAITTAGWYVVVVNLPATQAKYDLHASCASGTVTVFAASLYEYQ